MRRSTNFSMLMLYFGFLTTLAITPPNNLLKNANGDELANHWQAVGEAFIEQTPDKNAHFRVQNKGSFYQDVSLPENAAEKYVLLIGRVASERINPDGAITGLPYLYGYMIEGTTPRGNKILSYLQGQQLLCSAKEAGEWVTAWGIFPVVEGTGVIRFFLNQAERKDVPQNGSAARFDDLGLYLFDNELEAKAFVTAYKDRK